MWKYVHTEKLVHKCYNSIIHDNQKMETKRPLSDEWINKLYIYIIEYYSGMKKNEVLMRVAT